MPRTHQMSTLHIVPPAAKSTVSVVDDGLSLEERWAREGRGELVSVRFEQRRHTRVRGGFWRDHVARDASGRWRKFDLAVPPSQVVWPPFPQWTPDMIQEALALVRAELAARGAKGSCRITVTSHDTSAWNCVEVAVRIGVLRATFSINAGTTRYAIPPEALVALGDHATSMTDEVKRAVNTARAQKGGQ
jgi:hypothetical protein